MKRLTVIFATLLLLVMGSQGQFLSVVGSKTVSAGTPTAATPTFSPAAGGITSGTTIAITSATLGATICYTLDGSTPTATTPGTCSHGTSISNGGSTSAITSALTVEAIATKASYINSSVGSAAYTIGSTSNYSDNFTTCNVTNGINTNWTSTTSAGTTGWNCSGGLVGSQGVQSIAYYSAGTWTDANQYSQLTCTALVDSTQDCVVVVRMSSSFTNGYFLSDDDPDQSGMGSGLYRNLGSPVQIANYSSYGGSNGDVIYVQIVGTTLTSKLNGSTLGTVTDSTYATGYAGIGAAITDSGSAGTLEGTWLGGTL